LVKVLPVNSLTKKVFHTVSLFHETVVTDITWRVNKMASRQLLFYTY
jgi:hypothetical protein